MITFAFPWIFAAALAGVLTVAALHLLSVRKPPALWLPTARFLPDRDVRAISRTSRPSDVWLMVLRMLALLFAGLAAAGVSWHSGASTRAVVIVATHEVARDTAAALTIVPMDESIPRAVIFLSDQRVIPTAAHVSEPGAVFPIAWRTAAALASSNQRVDSIALHVLTSQRALTDDAGWRAWRATWPGRVTLHHTATTTDSVSVSTNRRVAVVQTRGAATRVIDDDPVVAALQWHGARQVSASGRVVDTIALLRDTDASPPSNYGVTIRWPRNGIPDGWRSNADGDESPDSAIALVAGEQALIAPWRVPANAPTDSFSTPPAVLPASRDARETTPRPIAWWSDGRVAATETRTATGCVRDVAVVADDASDVLLSPSAHGLFQQLLAPCALVDSVSVSTLTSRITDGDVEADANRFRPTAAADGDIGTRTRTIHALLLALGVTSLVVESLLRNRTRVRES